MGPGKYGFFPVHFLPIFWPRYSVFIRENDDRDLIKFYIYKKL